MIIKFNTTYQSENNGEFVKSKLKNNYYQYEMNIKVKTISCNYQEFNTTIHIAFKNSDSI